MSGGNSMIERYERMAATAPDELVAILEAGTLPEFDLTFAAEAAGKIEVDRADVIAALYLCMAHESPLVREGAVYGMAPHAKIGRAHCTYARAALEARMVLDDVRGVREAAAEALED